MGAVSILTQPFRVFIKSVETKMLFHKEYP